jgi:hypothetical protein
VAAGTTTAIVGPTGAGKIRSAMSHPFPPRCLSPSSFSSPHLPQTYFPPTFPLPFPHPLVHLHCYPYYISNNRFLLFWLLPAILHQFSAGKTTISRLLFRFYDPLEGTVEMGGYDIKRYTQKSVRQVWILKCSDCVTAC